MVLNFSDVNKAQIYKTPFRNSPQNEIEILMSFDFLNLLRPNEEVEGYHNRKPHDASFPFKIEDKKYINVGEKLFTFETNDEIVNHSSGLGFNDVKYPFAYGQENVYFMLHQKYIPIQEYENSTVKNEYDYFYKKDGELKGGNITDENEDFVEYGKDIIICIFILSRQKKSIVICQM